MISADLRKEREKAHGKNIASNAERVWMRHTRSGQQRMENRFADLALYLGLGKDATLLELGCGTGTWTVFLKRLAFRITSVDISEDLLKVAREKAPGVEFLAGDIEHLPFPKDHFHVVCGLSVLHHLDSTKALAEIYRVLKPGGRIWFSEPNMLNPQIFLQKNIPLLKRWAGDTPDETAFVRWPLKRQLKRAGFTSIMVRPFDFLHPLIPSAGTELFDRVGRWLERVPGVREIAGSLLVHAEKPEGPPAR
jgi:ubiquinone/menaquinone biosynthesis C-methylase UbiE